MASCQRILLLALALALSGCASKKASVKTEHMPRMNAPVLGGALDHARVLFRRGHFAEAIVALGEHTNNVEAMWIKAESLFRCARVKEAKVIFKALLDLDRDKTQAQKIHLRIFECDLKSRDLTGAINSYLNYQKLYKKVPDFVSYAMGKFLYDAGYHAHATTILQTIAGTSEFAMRALYLVGAMHVDLWPAQQAVTHFALIASMKPVSVEDYTVQQLAILAEARIWADAHDFVQAQKAYERVSLKGACAEEATAELVKTMIFWAESLSADHEYLGKQALDAALKAIGRYRAIKEISWRNLELYTQMARLLVKTRRYDEARLAYNGLIQHYRAMSDQLAVPANAQGAVWPYFALQTAGPSPTVDESPFFFDVPHYLARMLPDLSPVMTLKARVEATSQRLSGLEQSKGAPEHALERNQDLVNQYYELARLVQDDIRKQLAPLLNKTLAEAEFGRGELALSEMQDLQKQINAVRKFQSEKIINFEKKVAKIGGPS